jgi:hypothetical protein
MNEKLDLGKYSHMPFLFEENGQKFMIFSSCENFLTGIYGEQYMPWTIYCINLETNEKFRVNTYLSEKNVECSGSMFYDDEGMCNFSFIGTNFETQDILKYYITTLKGPNLRNLSSKKIEEKTFTGTITNDWYVYSKKYIIPNTHTPRDTISIVNKKTKNTKTINLFETVYRMVEVFDQKDKLIVTGSENDHTFSILYDMNIGTHQVIKVNGDDVYKCSILGDEIACAVKLDGFEEREIKFYDSYELV